MSGWRGESDRDPPRKARRVQRAGNRVTEPAPSRVRHTPPCETCGYPLVKADKECPRCRWEGRLDEGITAERELPDE